MISLPEAGISPRVVKFLLVGVLNTAVHALCALVLVTQVGAVPALANAIAFATATVVSYIGNTLWSFGATPGAAQLGRFIAAQLFGVLLAALVTGIVDALGAHYAVGIICVPLFVTPVMFLLHRSWTYR
jgi:putative flippase GtrA